MKINENLFVSYNNPEELKQFKLLKNITELLHKMEDEFSDNVAILKEDGNVTDAVLKANYVGAQIDKDLMDLLLESTTREELRDFLLNLLNSPSDSLLFETEKSTVSYLSNPLISFWSFNISF